MVHLAKKILCPIDLSGHSLEVINLATTLAIAGEGEIVFLYVAMPKLPESSGQAIPEFEHQIEIETEQFLEVHPNDDRVAHQNIVVRGKPGEEIVKAAKEHGCDLIVLNTHGRTGLNRLVMGSVAEFVIRHAHCPVLTVRNRPIRSSHAEAHEGQEQEGDHPVTAVMHQIDPVKGFDKMENVMAHLKQDHKSGVPVVDDLGYCIGILTITDIRRYRDMQRRGRKGDLHSLDANLEIGEEGIQIAMDPYDEVHRHMSMPVITVGHGETVSSARRRFQENPNIHHLVVIDAQHRPVGVLDTADVLETNSSGAGS